MLYVEEGYWAGITSDGTLVTYICPDKYCNCTRAPGGLRAGCLFDPNNSDGQCSKNREGWLCGKCSGNTSVGLRYHCYAPINVKPRGGGQTQGILTFSWKPESNSQPLGT